MYTRIYGSSIFKNCTKYWIILIISLILPISESSEQLPLEYQNIKYYNTITRPQDRQTLHPLLYLNESFIRIGGLFSITDINGISMFYTIQRLLAFQCIIEATNAANVLQNKTIVYEIIDIQQSPSESLAAALFMLQEQDIVMIVGPGVGDLEPSIPVASILSAYNVSGITYEAGGASGLFRYQTGYARTSPTDSFAADAVISLCLALNWTLVTPIFLPTEAFNYDTSYFETQASISGIYFDCSTNIPGFQTPKDIALSNSILVNTSNCLLSSQSKVIVLFMPLDIASNIVDSLIDRTTGITYIFATFYLYSSSLTLDRLSKVEINSNLVSSFAIIPPALVKFYSTLNLCPITRNPYTNSFPKFMDYWEIAFSCYLSQNRTPIGTPTLPQCSENVTSRNSMNISCICTGNEVISSSAVDPRIGYVADAVIFYVAALNRILTNCSSIPFGDYCNKTSLTGLDIFLVGNAFPINGTTGNIYFDNGDLADPKMDIIQLDSIVPLNATDIGNYTHGGIVIDYSKLYFSGESIPISAIVPRDEDLSTAFGVITFAIAIILCIFQLLIVFLIYHYKDAPVVKRMSPTFCILILVGMMLSLISIILWCIDPNDLICILRVWAFIIGNGLIFTNLLVKIYRIHRIFHGKRRATIKGVSDIEMLRVSGIICSVNIIVLIIYTFASGIPSPIVVHLSSNYLYSYTVCEVPSSDLDDITLGLLLVFNGLLLFISALIAYQTRDVDKRFNESARVATVVYFTLIIVFVAIAVYYSVQDTINVAVYQFAARSYAVILTIIVLDIALFGPVIELAIKDLRNRRGHVIIDLRNVNSNDEYLIGRHVSDHYRLREASDSQTDEFPEFSNLESTAGSTSNFVSRGLWRSNSTSTGHMMSISDASDITRPIAMDTTYSYGRSATMSTIESNDIDNN